jgi:hypothetical protein
MPREQGVNPCAQISKGNGKQERTSEVVETASEGLRFVVLCWHFRPCAGGSPGNGINPAVFINKPSLDSDLAKRAFSFPIQGAVSRRVRKRHHNSVRRMRFPQFKGARHCACEPVPRLKARLRSLLLM